MNGSIYEETLEKAMQSDEKTYWDFINKLKAYNDYIAMMCLSNPDFEMSFEEYVEKFAKET